MKVAFAALGDGFVRVDRIVAVTADSYWDDSVSPGRWKKRGSRISVDMPGSSTITVPESPEAVMDAIGTAWKALS